MTKNSYSLRNMVKSQHVWLGIIGLIFIAYASTTLFNRAKPVGQDRGLSSSESSHPKADEKSSSPQATSKPSNAEESKPLMDSSLPSGVQKLLFSREDYIYFFNPDSRNSERIVRGHDPSLSPTGSSIAFTDNTNGPRNPQRTIKVFDLKTNHVTEFSSLTGLISCCPEWSHDGARLAFKIIVGDQWHVGILNLANGEWVVPTKALPGESGFSFDSWSEDDKSIVCHSLDYIYETTLDGQVLSKMPLGDIMDKSLLSGTTRLLFSRDRRYILFDTTRIPDQNTAIYIFDVEKKVRARVTPETVNASEPQWLPSEKEILFLQLRKNQKGKIRFDVSKISLDGSNLVTLIENACSVSYSRQQTN